MVKIVDMTDALKQVREYTEKEPYQIKTKEGKLEISNADKKINSPAYQNYKAGDTEHYIAADDLEEQKRQLEEEIKCLSEEMDSMIQEKRQEGFAVRFLDPANKKRFVAAFKTKKDADDKAAQLKRDGLKDISITQHTLNFKEAKEMGGKWIVKFQNKKAGMEPAQAIFDKESDAIAFEKEKKKLGFVVEIKEKSND